MNKFVNYVKAVWYADVYVPLHYCWFSHQLKVMGGVETVDKIINDHVSMSRFGDYEYMSLHQESNNFNRATPELAARLHEVLNTPIPNHIVCIPHGFVRVKDDRKNARIFWKYFVAQNGEFILQETPRHRIYYDTNFTRFWMDNRKKDRKERATYINHFRQIWSNRNLLIVEGNDSRFGVGDDFLDNSTSVRRILCPSTDAFLKYEEIHDEIKAHARKDDLILLALGATATVLAYDLAKEGFQALDIGHADIEYCWFMMDAREKVPVSGKAVNEVGINHAGNNEDIAYQSQIIVKIS